MLYDMIQIYFVSVMNKLKNNVSVPSQWTVEMYSYKFLNIKISTDFANFVEQV